MALGLSGTACEIGFQEIADIKIYDKYKDTDSLETVVNHADVLFICLPTPTNDDGSCNLGILFGVIKEIAQVADKSKCIVIKSTIPPGTTDRLQSLYSNRHTFFFNPEFLTEKNFIDDFKRQNRIILGHSDNSKLHATQTPSYKKLLKLYEDFRTYQMNTVGVVRATILECKAKEAEFTKYITNCFLATKISFFNEMYQLCEASETDYNKVVDMVLFDDRITRYGTKVPGDDGQLGWAKSCFPKDIQAFIAYAEKLNIEPIMLQTAWTKNLLVRESYDWENLPQCTGDYGGKK